MSVTMEETVEDRERWEREERMAETAADVLRSELEQQFPGGRMLGELVQGGYVRQVYGVEVYSGSTPQSERWVAVKVSASLDHRSLWHVELLPERTTRTGRRVRGGFYCPNVRVDESSITCSSGPALNGGEGPGRMAMFTGCLQIAERILARCESGELEGSE